MAQQSAANRTAAGHAALNGHTIAPPPLLDQAAPYRFVPFLRPMVWGGRRLAEVLGRALPSDGPYGESWELSDHPSHHSVVADGPCPGQTLHDLLAHDPEAILGRAAHTSQTFPWLVKFLDAQDWLSVQVHPDEEAVKRLWPGEGSKTEVWFVLDAQPGSRIYAGLQPGVDERRLRAALAAGNVTDCLHSFEPRPGDSVFLPAGTVHAVGGGVLMAEVQQTSDATFRLFDWNRQGPQGKPRTLHIEQAMASIDWKQGPVHAVPAAGFAAPIPANVRQLLADSRYFALEYIQDHSPINCSGDRLEILIIVNGTGFLEGPSGQKPLEPGQVWLLPAQMRPGACRPAPCLGLLRCTLPMW
jgi:mannose-6-phosphate isomerase